MTSIKQADEMAIFAGPGALRKDMRALSAGRHNPFKNPKTGPDNYLEFVTHYNEFINHRAKPFRKIVDRLMKM
ncbi:MAG: hypothetical protein V1701_06125 [Planctomycetota bacterium]